MAVTNPALSILTLAVLLAIPALPFQNGPARRTIPKVLGKEFSYDASGNLKLFKNDQSLSDLGNTDKHTLAQMLGNPLGAETGIALDFQDPNLNGTVAYGPYEEGVQHPAIAFLPEAVPVDKGHALLEISKVFVGANDFYHFSERGSGILGFRVISNVGRILYEGRVAFSGKGPYRVMPTLVEGPLVNLLQPTSCVISYETQASLGTTILVNGKIFQDQNPGTHHEIAITGLTPGTSYQYTVQYGDRTDVHRFKTQPPTGSRTPFTFGFIADNRANTGGGERDLGGVNYLSARAAMSVATLHNIAFLQAMGGNTTGNNTSVGGHMLEHANWKRALEPFWSTIPVYAGMGNHEANYDFFSVDTLTKKVTRIDRFPYQTESGEATFAKAFVNPENGPESEDGASYDPDPVTRDFPTYKENVYSYTYGNVAMIVLNSEYWKSSDPKASGSPEGYVMDQQLKWLDATIQKFEADPAIDHVFINLHSCVFPNGDHTDAGMWYSGHNDARPMVAGVPVGKGIIERRDQLIDAAINRSTKVIGFLVGSEHNFAFLEVTPDLPIYPDGYALPKLKIKRNFFYINNGGGGTYPYAKLHNTPWAEHFQYFAVPPSLALFHVDGQSVTMQALNPETFETICTNVKLR